ncbi:hypothetical protein A0J48_004910 [Sphaerospermopsis aphanizomenoides BCCUSP55]|uniref:hypothetical protein n=1 Tax=Sphaerospermopsis aphanizomenoides TaxID=459663 RepID=UPI000B173FAB|nr:hypothetical protein [Sphaerospermopsis aphanizomenoides]MBK1986888.1 hypothetical protein [Sphaerospermopsis aphanizomenoides BCCUSP55]
MIYGNMPMMIFILAAGYLLTVYLLLALAKRTGRNSVMKSRNSFTQGQHGQERGLRTKVTEVVNSQ